MRRWSGMVLIATLLWLGWLNRGKMVRGSTLAERPQYPDIFGHEESSLSQLVNWNRMTYGAQHRKRRGHLQPISNVKQCRNRLPEAIMVACQTPTQASHRSPQQFSADEELQGGLYGRVMMRKRSSPRPQVQYTNAYDECCQNGPCNFTQLQKYCHHYKFSNSEIVATTEAPTEPPTTVTFIFKPACCAEKQLVNVPHRLLGSKQGRVSVRSDARSHYSSSQNFKPQSNRLRIKNNSRMTSSSELLLQTSKCLAEEGCKKELGDKIMSAILKNEDQLKSLGGLCKKEIQGSTGQERAPDILRIIFGLIKAFVSPPSSNNSFRNSTGDCYSSSDDAVLADQYQAFQNRYLSRRPCQPVPTESKIEIGAPNIVDTATYE